MKPVRILIGGDVCPRSAVLPCFESGDAVGIFHDLLDDFRAADLSVINLECPLTDVDSPIPKTGAALRAPSACISALKNTGIHVLNLANNHILDHGASGSGKHAAAGGSRRNCHRRHRPKPRRGAANPDPQSATCG